MLRGSHARLPRMTFHAFGLSHETASVAVREAFALDEAARRRLYGLLRLSDGAEVVLLSTCNRTEAVVFGYEADVATVRAALSVSAGAPWPEGHAFALTDEAAVLHVLRLASGLESQVLGDAQILAQLKDAYRVAVEADAVGPLEHRLMHAAFRAAKRVRTETGLYEGAASISSLAVRAARLHFEAIRGEATPVEDTGVEDTGVEDTGVEAARVEGTPVGEAGRGLVGQRVLLLGTGEMGVAALRSLAAEGAALTVANRSRAGAEAAASLVGAEVLDWADRHDADADLILVASGAAEPVLWADRLPARSAPRLVIDVAVPRNVDPAVADLPGVTLLDLDRLSRWRDATTASRAAAEPAAEAICQEALAEFVAWVFNHEALQPTIQALRDTFEAIRRQEIERHAWRFTGTDAEELDRLTRSIMQKVLAVPVVRLKSTEPESLDFARGIRFLSHVFARPDCDETSESGAPASMASDAPGCPVDHAPRPAQAAHEMGDQLEDRNPQ